MAKGLDSQLSRSPLAIMAIHYLSSWNRLDLLLVALLIKDVKDLDPVT
ncbi:hypothetical protein SLEP1_g17400 [Rubroshorea leprosula]|uniref:Uncharacterized protein n=1 Tax=Rubroshorea leprosula TaxID=152421 RepID=A0AAV5J017_9ROSI|nr:hypothetical protein SLEP1_g17400 [Rubroshorea leprosula]